MIQYAPTGHSLPIPTPTLKLYNLPTEQLRVSRMFSHTYGRTRVSLSNPIKIFRKKKRPRDEKEIHPDDVYELTAEGVETDGEESVISKNKNSDVKIKKKRFSWRVFLVRLVTYGLTVVTLMLVGLYTVIRLSVKPQDIAFLVKQLVEEETGGRLDIGSVKFNILTGISIEKVGFYPPSRGDTRGYLNKGEVEPVPVANFDSLDIHYSIPRLLSGRFHIKALQLVEPQVHLKQTDGSWNFDGILAYRRVNFGESQTSKNEDVKNDAPNSAPPAWFVRILPTLLYLPFDIMAQNIGIKNLRLDLIKEENGKIAQIIFTNGLTIDVGFVWQGMSNKGWVAIPSSFERPFDLDIKDAKRDPNGDLTTELVQTVALKAALFNRVELVDLKRINFDYAMRILSIETPAASYKDLSLFFKARLEADSDYRGLDIKTFNVSFLDAAELNVLGKITMPNGTPDKFDLKLEEKLNVNLTSLSTLVTPFLPGFKATGTLDFKDMWVEGSIEPAKISSVMTPDSGVQMPWVSAAMWLKDVAIEYPALQLFMEPINGSVAVAGGPAMGSQGSQIDVTMDLDVPKIAATQDMKTFGIKNLEPITVGVESLIAKMTTRFLLPQMTAPLFKFNVEAEHVTASGKGLSTVDAPLYIDIDADGRGDLQRLAMNASLELEGLADVTAMISCQFKCEKFRASANARLDSLKNLHAIALPLSGMFGLQKAMPTNLSGALDFQFMAKGKFPDPMKTSPQELIDQGDIRFSSQFNVSKLSAQIPLFKMVIDSFENRILMSGTLKQQKIELAQKFENISLDLPKKSGQTAATPLKMSRFSFDTTVTNDIEASLDLSNPIGSLATAVKTKIFIGRIEVEGLIPHPLSDVQVSVKAKQTKMTDIALEEFELKAPDFGANIGIKAATKLAADFMPKALSARINAKINHGGSEKLAAGVKTSGQVDVVVGVESKDMKFVAIQGATSFDDFNITIDGQDANGPPLVNVQTINGIFPFQQIIDLPLLLKQLEKKKLAAHKIKNQKTEDENSSKTGPGSDQPSLTPFVLAEEKEKISAKDDKTNFEAVMHEYFEKNSNKFLKNANVVALVDYASIRPFFPEKKPISIQKIEAANLELSKLEFDVELRQNWFAVNQFGINFLGGKIQGEFQLAFDPLPESLRTSVHMTRLDTRKLIERFPNLKGKATSWNLFSNPYIDGTIHLRFDPKSNDMSGGVEITSIGKEQLKMMLYYVDPYEQNPTISDIRTALLIGDVRQVSIPIKNGEIDLAVDIRVLSAPIPTPKLTRFPVSQIVQNFQEQATSETDTEKDDDEETPAIDSQQKDGPQISENSNEDFIEQASIGEPINSVKK
jgi:hypothetical protein